MAFHTASPPPECLGSIAFAVRSYARAAVEVVRLHALVHEPVEDRHTVCERLGHQARPLALQLLGRQPTIAVRERLGGNAMAYDPIEPIERQALVAALS